MISTSLSSHANAGGGLSDSIDEPNLRPAPVWANIVAGITRRLPRGKSRFIEWLCRGSEARFLARMPAEIGGYQFDCCLRDTVARDVFFAGCFAAQEIAFLRGVLKPGMTFVDVGANWGLFTLVAAYLVGTSGIVAAMEPDPRMFGRLKANVEGNNLRQVRVFEVAIADRDSNLVLAAHDHAGNNWGISRVIEGDTTDQMTFNVPSRQLDPLLDKAGFQTVDLLKIDVEGAEDMVLTGMDAGLSGHRYRCILLELHPAELAERGRMVCEITDILITKGYQGYAFDNSRVGARRAYYHPWLPFSEFVRPLQQGLVDREPHTLWLSPGQKELVKDRSPRRAPARTFPAMQD